MEFQVLIEKDSEGFYVAEVPALKSCYSQAKSYDELIIRIKEAIELCLEVEEDFTPNEFIGLQKVVV